LISDGALQQDGGHENRQGGVLGAGDVHAPGKGQTPFDNELVHEVLGIAVDVRGM